MKFKNLISIIAALSIINVTAFAQDAQNKFKLGLSVEGKEIQKTVYEAEKNIMLPLREVCDALGYELKWNSENASCEIDTKDMPIEIYIGKNYFVVDRDMVVELSYTPEIKDGSTYVPIKTLEYFDVDISAYKNNISIKNSMSNEKTELKYNNENDGITSIELNAGDMFSIALSENITTGYSWHVTKDDSILEISQTSVVPSTPGLSGAPNTKTWVFRADSKGDYNIKFEYKRPWENKAPEKVIEYNITVK